MKWLAYLLCLVFLLLVAAGSVQAAVVNLTFSGTYERLDSELFGLSGEVVPYSYQITYDTSLNTQPMSIPTGGSLYGYTTTHEWHGYSASGITASNVSFGSQTWTAADISNPGIGVSDMWFDTDISLFTPTLSFVAFLGGTPGIGSLDLGSISVGAGLILLGLLTGSAIDDYESGQKTSGEMTITSSVPEPSTMILAGLAALGILRLFVLRKRRQSICAVVMVALCVLVSMVGRARANPVKYEPTADPSVGFNLISWWNFGGSGTTVWSIAVQSLYDAGFRQVSINPVRYFDPNTGAIAASSQKGPTLQHIAAGIVRAKSLGMTVTVTPFVEYKDFTQWRAYWDPTPGGAVSSQFWSDYQQYLVDVAQVANVYGADSMNVGTELRGLVQNPGNNAHWNAAINAVAANFSGQLGYAANWDDFKDGNLTDAIWNHPAIDYMGVDAYFPTATTEQADTSGTNPNPAFINLLTENWNAQLDGDILPFAQSLKGGTGMPVVFSETGLVAYNRTTATPWDVMLSNPDQDEQMMGFKALIAATDHRKGDDNLLSINLWQWGMPGSNGSIWNMGVTLPADQPLNLPATQYLADFITHPIPEPSTFVLAALGILGVLACARRRARRPDGS